MILFKSIGMNMGMSMVCIKHTIKKLNVGLSILSCLGIMGFNSTYAQTQPELMAAAMQAGVTNNPLAATPLSIRNNTNIPAATESQVVHLKPLPAPTETEFQRFVQRTTGQALLPYGGQLFNDAEMAALAANDTTPVMADYTLGVGDEVLIKAWGAIDVDYKAAIDRNGQIILPKVGALRLAGIRANQLETTVQQALSRLYKNFSVNATLGKLRPVRVYVVGQALQPKVYLMPAMSTLLSAIFASGGPASSGSMRAITLQRAGKTLMTFDVYDFLLKGDRTKDTDLRDGDTIVFNPIGTRVAVLGAVDKPYIYELKATENHLADLFKYLGALSISTSTLNATIERLTPSQNTARSLIQIKLDTASQKTTELNDGDVLTLQAVRDEFQNVVTLRGNVALPLRYPYRANMRIRDLIPDRQALITADYFVRKNILVQSIGANTLKTSIDTKTEGNFILSNSTINKPQINAETVLADSINLADNINWDYAVIERLLPDLKVQLIPFNLGAVILANNDEQNLVLQPGDVVTVFSNRDLRMAQSKLTRTIKLEGEFNIGGVYQVKPKETLRQLVQRVGGLTQYAYVYGAVLTRHSVRVNQQRSMDIAIEKLERDLNLQSLTRAASSTEGASQPQAAQVAAQFVAKLKSVKATGRMVIDITAQAGLADIPDIEIEDGDVLYIPPLQATVAVLGAVHNEHTVIYTPGKSLKSYIEQAGGTTPSADTDNIYVLRANGSIHRKTNGWLGWLGSNIDLKPGDAVVIPEDIRRFDTIANYKNWASVFSQFALGVASLKVLGIY